MTKMNQRLTKLCTRMTKAGMDAALLLHPRDILYYAGTVRPATLLVTPHDAILSVRRGIEYARQEATTARVEPMSGLTGIAETLTEMGLTDGVLGTELDVISAQIYQRLMQVFPSWKLTDVSPLVLAQRAIKDEDEIAATRHAADIADAGHRIVPQVAAPGMSELALAAEVEAAMRRAGHEGYQSLRHPNARGGGVLMISGENQTVRGGYGLVVTGGGLSPGTPYGPSRRVLQPGDLVVVDTGSTGDSYTADESRAYVLGQATELQQALFAATLAAQNAVFEMLRPGVAIADLYAAAEAVVHQGTPPTFAPGNLTLPGFVGHGVGLEIDEPPVIWPRRGFGPYGTTPREELYLQAGMVLAIEVEVSAPAQGMMIKLEDTIVVRPDGYELLTGAPRELIEIGE
jgi:Xaa-Pro dipeptidase